ncbi:MAG: T9SS type A sorting domain-containing protein [Candidatus Kapabacteria bacterium]|nr:T9SS type A sorting domain-containing protein [Candidatus Kapabacteria bacterium]
MKSVFMRISPLLIFSLLIFCSCKENNSPAVSYIMINDLDEPTSGFQFFTYPNPVSNRMNINLVIGYEMPVTILISDMYGRELMKLTENNILAIGNHTFEANVDNLAPGVYFVLLNIANKTFYQKFIIFR